MAAHGLFRKRGFSLIEAMLAVSVFTIGMLGVLPMIMYTIQGNWFGIRMTKAASLCQDKIEELKVLPYNDASLADATRGLNDFIPAYPTAGPEYFDDYGRIVPTAAGATFIRQWRVEERAAPLNLKIVRVEVYWLDPRYGRTMTVRAGVTVAGRSVQLVAIKGEE